MERKIEKTGMIMTLLLISILAISITQQAKANETICTRADGLTNPITAPIMKPQALGPQGPGYYETSEYLIGSVAFSVIPLESNGAIDPQTENWNDGGISEIGTLRDKISSALNWWSSQNPNASVSFRGHPRPDFRWRVTQPVPISYEPINRPSTDEGLWIGEAMTYLGFPGTDYYNQTVAYLNWLRVNYGPSWGSEADWAFTIFMVDSSNDADGRFADGKFSYAYLGGPFIVMTYTNNGYGPEDLDRTAAHEIGHIFYATDEDDGITEYSGYLNVADVENSGGVMYGTGAFGWYLSAGTWGQVGWRDSDSDGIQDIVDTFPNTFLNPYSPDPTIDSTLTYAGTVTETPYTNNNPYGIGRNITINRIINVEFRVDDGPWIDAAPDDGTFNETEESFSFTTPPISPGTHTIETRGTNSVGNVETTYATDTVTIEGHDVAVTSVVPFKTVVVQGYNLNINVTTINQGDYTEIFNVTVYANETNIATFANTTLTIGNSTTLIFTWNTTGFAYGNYTISAVAEPVPGETNTADNTFIDGIVVVTIPGDVDGNFNVDILDVVKITGIYAFKRGDLGFNPNSDINDDGQITILDVVACTSRYGQEWP